MHASLERNFQDMAGARAVQVASALLKNGPQHLAGLRAGLARVVEERGYASLSEMHGCVNLARCPDTGSFERGNPMRVLCSARIGAKPPRSAQEATRAESIFLPFNDRQALQTSRPD